MQRNYRRLKATRIKRGKTPRVLDLFAGCGGLSLGFLAAGFEIVGAVESDPLAAKSHALNFHRTLPPDALEEHSKARDITHAEPRELAAELRLGSLESSVDVIVGGPPCQAFARVGRAKLREIARHPRAFLNDPRSNLYLRYLHYVKQFRPLAILIENVPDVLNFGGHNIAEEICEVLGDMGYSASYTLLNAAYYGAPQMRERMFLIAYADELSSKVRFPAPTHWVELPRGYEGTRNVALRTVEPSLFQEKSSYVPAPKASPSLSVAVTAKEAIGDLPAITVHLEGKLKRGARRFTEFAAYPPAARLTRYQELMRSWPGFEGSGGVKDHVIRCLPRDYQIFRRMNPGDQYPEAYQHAQEILRQRLMRLARAGTFIVKGSAEYRRIAKGILPPYDPGKFPNKWRKMEADRPARTLMAHLGKDGYSHIHYDSEQARTISVREAARLQSFPDGFEFQGTMNPAFRQIGNAVPPLLAAAIARSILQGLRGEQDNEQTVDQATDVFRSYIL